MEAHDYPMSDRRMRVHAEFMALTKANATNSGAQWVTSVYEGIQQARFLQIWGGGPNEWRIPKTLKRDYARSLDCQTNPYDSNHRSRNERCSCLEAWSHSISHLRSTPRPEEWAGTIRVLRSEGPDQYTPQHFLANL